MSSKKSVAASKPYALCSNCPERIAYGERRQQRRTCKEASCRGALCVDCFRRSATCDHCRRTQLDHTASGHTNPGNLPVDIKTNTKITEYFKKRAQAAAAPVDRAVRELDQPDTKRTKHH